MELTSSFFFNNTEDQHLTHEILFNLKNFAEQNVNPIYLLNRPLSEKKYDYTMGKVFIFLSPGTKIYIVNLNLNTEDLEELYLDFIEDLGHIADKYEYTDVIDRPRKWKKYIERINIDEFVSKIEASVISDFFQENSLSGDIERRTVELLISLLTGSINSIKRVGKLAPQSDLEKIKQNIILFDGDQTRFIFEENYEDKIIKVQGLAGTGKTELLLHRLKEIYLSDSSYKIAFTCQSKTLANRLKVRVKDFFDFMKVEKQIEWNEKLWVMHAWGSTKYTSNNGLYAYICKNYDLPFYTPSDGSFKFACEQTLSYAKSIRREFEPLFDFILIDEGQDFTDDFFELCKLATRNEVFVAGDIFQDIFGIQKIEYDSHYLLNKCYRTDPRTMMFAHGIGMGLFEKPIKRWLQDDEWNACGYSIDKVEHDMYQLTREPVRRFGSSNLDHELDSVKIIENSTDNELNNIIETIGIIKEKYPDVKPDDIAIVYTNPYLDYKKIDNLSSEIYKKFHCNINRLHSTKAVYEDHIVVSNKNNIKGLEFPFVICIVDYKIDDEPQNRNTIYMALTRSFITSYLIINEDSNANLISSFKAGLQQINENMKIVVKEPSDEDKKFQQKILSTHNKTPKSQHEIIAEIFEQLNVTDDVTQNKLRDTVLILKGNITNREELENTIRKLLETL